MPSKKEAQQRADQIKEFKSELVALEKDGVISLSDEQNNSINSYHSALLSSLAKSFDIDRTTSAKQLSTGMKIASFLGALALAASVFFLFYQFWGYFDTTTQVAILITAPVVTFLATMLVSSRETTGYFSKLLGLVTFACFVLNISMMGQIFNIIPSDKAFIVWGAFAFLIAYACDVRLLLAAGILCTMAFISARMGTWCGGYWLHFGERPENFFPAALIFFFLPQFIKHQSYSGFSPIYRVFALLALFLPILILSNWGAISYMDMDNDLIEGIYQVAGFTLCALAIWLGIKRGWNDVVNTANTFFVIFLYTKFFEWWWELMPKYLFFLIVALTAMLFLFIFKRMRGTTNLSVDLAHEVKR